MGIVLNYCQYGVLYLGSYYDTGPYINFPHFGNSNLGKLSNVKYANWPAPGGEIVTSLSIARFQAWSCYLCCRAPHGLQGLEFAGSRVALGMYVPVVACKVRVPVGRRRHFNSSLSRLDARVFLKLLCSWSQSLRAIFWFQVWGRYSGGLGDDDP